MKITHILFVIGALLFPAFSWGTSVVPVWYLGGWEYQSCDSKNIMCMVKDISFNLDGTYGIDAYPPARHRGKYVVESIMEKSVTESEAVLRLSNQTGDWAPWKSQIKIVYNPQKNTLTIDGEGPYSKLADIRPKHREPNEK